MTRTTLPASRYDVVVVGARCAGAATAMLLSRAGHRVLLVDRGRYGTDTLSTHALMRGAVLQLHRWHVLPSVIASGAPPVRQATFFYGGEAVVVPIAARDGIDALYAPRRHVLDRLLVDAAVTAGVDVVHGVTVRGLLRSPSAAVTGAVLHDQSGQVHHVTARVVVGADGLQSTVARLVGAAPYHVGRHASATVYGYWTDLDVDGYEWHFVPGIATGAIPTNAGGVCIFVSVARDSFPRLFAGGRSRAFQRLLWQVAPDLARQTGRVAPPHLVGFGGHVGFFRTSHGPGWALVGDAGYFKDPLTSHGITDALRDAESLAGAIDDGSPGALAEYQAERDAASHEVFDASDQIASFDWDLREVRRLHETLARAMAREVRQLARA